MDLSAHQHVALTESSDYSEPLPFKHADRAKPRGYRSSVRRGIGLNGASSVPLDSLQSGM